MKSQTDGGDHTTDFYYNVGSTNVGRFSDKKNFANDNSLIDPSYNFCKYMHVEKVPSRLNFHSNHQRS